MKEFNSCKAAIESCIKNKYFAIAHLYNDEKPMNMHIHDCYEIYFSISGGKQFLIDNRFYNIAPGDIFFINQYESHYLTQIDAQIHERIIVSIHPDFLASLSSCETNLDSCFCNRENGSSHKLHLDTESARRFVYYIHKISDIVGFGSDLLEKNNFIEMMIFLNSIYANQIILIENDNTRNHIMVDDILSYVNQHIADQFSLDDLASHFYLSTSYICRIFKASTGTTINKYLTAKRITLAKSLLTEGCSVSLTCEQCGFNDYSNFLKSFTKAVGISPKKYAQMNSL